MKGMNKTSIEWTDYTWNPVTGCMGPNGDGVPCLGCYAAKLAQRLRGRCGYPGTRPFTPTYHADKLRGPSSLKCKATKNPDGKGPMIFAVSMGDIADAGMTEINEIFGEMKRNPDITFQMLTKRPEVLAQKVVSTWPDNLWLGTSISAGNEVYRLDHLRACAKVGHKLPGKLFASFEPLRGAICDADLDMIDWIIIGQETGVRPGIVEVKWYWVDALVRAAKQRGIPYFLKDNLKLPDTYHTWPER